jgi:hypothetical protein
MTFYQRSPVRQQESDTRLPLHNQSPLTGVVCVCVLHVVLFTGTKGSRGLGSEKHQIPHPSQPPHNFLASHITTYSFGCTLLPPALSTKLGVMCTSEGLVWWD